MKCAFLVYFLPRSIDIYINSLLFSDILHVKAGVFGMMLNEQDVRV